MKSVLITFLMFFVVFTLLKMNILDIFSQPAFHAISYISIIVVLGCAVYFVGIPSRSKEIAQQQINEKVQNNDEK